MATWIRRPRARPRAVARLLCLPCAGGGVSTYRRWGYRVPDVEVLCAQPPGRGDRLRESPCEQVEQVVDGLVAELDEWSDLPLALFGHSLGALVAYELAVRLEHVVGRRVSALAVAGATAPDRRPPTRALSALDDADLVAALLASGGLPAELLDHPGLIPLVLPAIRADLRVLANYEHRPQAALSCPILALAGEDDADAPPALMREWSRFTEGEVTVATFRGGHFFVVDHVEQVLSATTHVLRASAGR